MTDLTTVKQRFGIIGVSPLLDRALEVALRVAPTDLSVLVTGESGVGKEFSIIRQKSARVWFPSVNSIGEGRSRPYSSLIYIPVPVISTRILQEACLCWMR